MLTPQSQVFLDAIKTRVVIADGAMGTMIQDAAPSLDDFQGYEGCNEILNVTRPELIESIHAQLKRDLAAELLPRIAASPEDRRAGAITR